jgi:hypothetical protein
MDWIQRVLSAHTTTHATITHTREGVERLHTPGHEAGGERKVLSFVWFHFVSGSPVCMALLTSFVVFWQQIYIIYRNSRVFDKYFLG